MPALLTHDFFGQDVYAANAQEIGEGKDERDAFLLGNQGPDPLFYTSVNPRYHRLAAFGGEMHHTATSSLFAALTESLETLTPEEASIGRAYAAGFACHYLLDRAMHPFVYSQQYALCNAGVEGLSNEDEHEVHAEIERELDEMVLFAKTGTTIASYRPYAETLHASEDVLAIINKMLSFVALRAFKKLIPEQTFSAAVHGFRMVQRVFFSPKETMHAAANAIETRLLKRNYSFFKSMAHKNKPVETSIFGNHDNQPWENPFTGQISTLGFWDIYHAAQLEAPQAFQTLFDQPFDLAAARTFTRGLNFSGEAGHDA